jgi:hypothetical protein
MMAFAARSDWQPGGNISPQRISAYSTYHFHVYNWTNIENDSKRMLS